AGGTRDVIAYPTRRSSDLGDEGVVEYVVSELVRCLHGFGTDTNGNPEKPWDGVSREITGLKVGIVGLGTSGGMIADALKFFGARSEEHTSELQSRENLVCR